MADWIDTIYENNWHELPELDEKKVHTEAFAAAQEVLRTQRLARLAQARHLGDNTPVTSNADLQATLYGPGGVGEVLQFAARYYAGYMEEYAKVMKDLADGTLSPAYLEAIRAEQRRRQREKRRG